MDADAQPGTDHAGVDGCFQEEHRQVVRCVVAVFVYAADGQAFAAEAAAVSNGHAAGILEFHRIVQFNVLGLEELECEFFREGACGEILLVVRVQPLVHAAVGDGVAVAFDLDEGGRELEELEGLPEGFRGAACYGTAVGCYLG